MSVTVNKSGQNTNDGPITSLANVWTGGGSNTLNDTNVGFTSWFGAGTGDLTSCTDDASGGSNVYSILKLLAFGGTGIFGAVVGCSGAKAATTLTFNFGSSVQFVRSAIGCASGAATSGSLNKADANYIASATTTPNALTSQSGTTATTVDGCLIVGWICNITSAGQGGLTGTSPLTFTQWNTQNNPGDSDSQLMEYATQTTHGTVAATGTSPSSGDGVGIFMVAIAPPGGASGPPASQFFLGEMLPLAPLAWIIRRRQKLQGARNAAWGRAPGGHSWRQDKKSRLFLPNR